MAAGSVSDEWGAVLEAAGRCPAMGTVDATVVVVLVGGADGERRLTWRCRDGTPELRDAPDPDDPGRSGEVTFTLTVAEGRAILAGQRPPAVAFMRGDMKTAGDPGAVLDVLAVTAGPQWSAWWRRVEAATGT